MATIHQFKSVDRTKRPARAPVPETGAEIIFFPGVRYERWAEKAAIADKNKRKRRNRVKRDKISIVV
jgi:hypothetical protein